MKLCKDCKYYEETVAGSYYAGCSAPQTSSINYIRGTHESVRAQFSREKMPYIKNPCGPEAKHFQLKETLWQKVAKLLNIKSTDSKSSA